jgi:membrane protein
MAHKKPGVRFADARNRVDRWQQRWPPAAFTVAVIKKFIDDRGPNLGVQIAYWGFFSVFALLLAFVAILGFLFEGNPSFQHDVRTSALEQMPVIGPQISGNVGSLTGSGVALAIGIVAALWTGLSATLAVGSALDRVWAVPRVNRAGFVSSRTRGFLVLVSVGTLIVGSTALVGLATEATTQSGLAKAAEITTSVAVDLVTFLACFRLLTSAPVTIRSVFPGAGVAAIAWLALQAVGALYVANVVKGNSQVYGGFAAVAGLLSWMLLGAQVTLIAAEVNVVLARRLWPRSIAGSLVLADQRALADAVKAEQCDVRQHITVGFEPSGETSNADAINACRSSWGSRSGPAAR